MSNITDGTVLTLFTETHQEFSSGWLLLWWWQRTV